MATSPSQNPAPIAEPTSGVSTHVKARHLEAMGRVESRLLELTDNEIGIVRDLARHVTISRGKKLRPAFVLIGSQLFGAPYTPVTIDVACATELIHAATLLHDDVVDNSSTRRGKISANYKWGNTFAVLVGDNLLATAFSALAQAKSFPLLETFFAAAKELGEGVILELAQKENWKLSEDEYLNIIQKKTAIFFAACAKAGGILAEATDEEVQALSDFAFNFGMAFQLTDDLLDLVSTQAAAGKPVGLDLLEGRVTLPLIRFLGTEGTLDELMAVRAATNGDHEAAVHTLSARLEELGHLDYARAKAQGYIQRAEAALTILPEGDSKEYLIYLTEKLINRQA